MADNFYYSIAQLRASALLQKVEHVVALAAIVSKLGPARSQAALGAFKPGQGESGWCDCPVARAYGEPGVLIAESNEYDKEMRRHNPSILGTIESVAAIRLGLTIAEVRALVRAFDACDGGGVVSLRGALEILLEAEASRAVVVEKDPSRFDPAEITVAQTMNTKVIGKDGNVIVEQTAQVVSAPPSPTPEQGEQHYGTALPMSFSTPSPLSF